MAPFDLAAVPVVSRGPLRARIVRFLLPAGTGRGAARPTGGPATGRFGTLLELRDADGRRGWGEASPLPGYAAETPGHAAAVLLTWLYALSDEFHQRYVPGRSAHWRDIFFDWLGALAGVWLWLRYTQSHSAPLRGL